jgi:hypothetical protein
MNYIDLAILLRNNFVLLEWDLVSGALVVFAVNVVVEFVVPAHCVALVAVPDSKKKFGT